MIRKTAASTLIIEDEHAIAEDLAYIAAELGHLVLGIARTHREATALARRKLPDLILSDIKLADGSSGLDAVLEIRRAGEVPVIFITGSPEVLRGDAGLSANFVISKPYRDDVLKATITQALGCSCAEGGECSCGAPEH